MVRKGRECKEEKEGKRKREVKGNLVEITEVGEGNQGLTYSMYEYYDKAAPTDNLGPVTGVGRLYLPTFPISELLQRKNF